MSKRNPNTFSGNISPEQYKQLLDWLTNYTYAEVCELIAEPEPDGFGIEVSISTLSRFYKSNEIEISAARRDKLSRRAESYYSHSDPIGYRSNLEEMATLSLQERLYEALSHPLNSVDDLKKLAAVCKQVKEMKLTEDPTNDLIFKEQMARLITGVEHKASMSNRTAAAVDQISQRLGSKDQL